MRAMQIDAQLTALSPDDFPTMVDYLTKFKELHIQLMGVGKKKKEDECIYLILSKLKGPFHVFASTLLSTKDAMGDKFIMRKLEEFCEHLTTEESKISTLEASSSSSKALTTSKDKGKPKPKPKTPTSQPAPKAFDSKSTPEKRSLLIPIAGSLVM